MISRLKMLKDAKRLPIRQESFLAQVFDRVPSTSMAEEKWKGDPIERIHRIEPVKGWRRGFDPTLSFPPIYQGLQASFITHTASDQDRLRFRQLQEHFVRRALAREAPKLPPEPWDKPGGLDFIRGPKIRPRLPGGLAERLPTLAHHRARGDQEQDRALPREVVVGLREARATVNPLPRKILPPLGRNFEVPVRTG